MGGAPAKHNIPAGLSGKTSSITVDCTEPHAPPAGSAAGVQVSDNIASHVPAMLGLAVTSALCSMVNLVLLCGPEGLGQKGYGQHQLFSTSCLCASCRTGALAIQQGGPPRPCCTVGQGAGQPQTTLCASSWTAFLSSKYFSESEQLLNFKACCLQKEACLDALRYLQARLRSSNKEAARLRGHIACLEVCTPIGVSHDCGQSIMHDMEHMVCVMDIKIPSCSMQMRRCQPR